jgi:tetratricopeptide (TPR) repeat protein
MTNNEPKPITTQTAGDDAIQIGAARDVTIIKRLTSPLVIIPTTAILILVAIIAFANLPAVREQLPAWLQPRAFPKEQEDEVLIVIATFHHTAGIPDTAAHDEIKRAIERETTNLNLRVEVAPTTLQADDRPGAHALGDRYDASLVIWGSDTGVRVTVNFFNRKQPDFHAADVQIQETTRTQIAAPSEYAEFITQDLPQQLTFLSLFALGQSHFAEEAYIESARVIEKAVAALEQQPDIVEGAAEAYFRLGWLYQAPLDDPEKAERNYTHAIELDPEFAMAYVGRGNNYYDMGEYAKAECDYTRAIELNPEFAMAYINRGNNYYGMGKYTQAESDYTRAIELNPEFVEAYVGQGLIYNAMGEYAKAESDYTRAIELNPEFAMAYNDRGINYYDMGEYAKAESDYTRAIELNPENAKAYNNRGIVYNATGEYASAERDYTRAIELNPEYALAYNDRGVNYYDMGEYAQAERDHTRAIELNPEYALAYINRGNNYNAMSKYEPALADFERAATLMTHPGIYYNGARAHAQLGHIEDACTWLEKALSEMPQWRDDARTDPDFDPIRDTPCFQALMESEE